LFEMTGGEGEDWDKAQDLGRQIDPQNTLYKSAGPIQAVDIDTGSEPPPDLRGDDDADGDTVRSMAPILTVEPVAAMPGSGYDLDLDIDLDAASTGGSMEATRPLGGAVAPTGAMKRASPPTPLPMSGEWNALSDEPPLEIMHTGMEPLPDLGLLDELPPGTERKAAGPLDFDFGELSLDLDQAPKARAGAAGLSTEGPTLRPDLDRVKAPAAEPTADSGPDSMSFDLEGDDVDPLQRKIELADEFRRIGDVEGARDLLDEVLSKAAGLTRDRAKAMLDELG